MLFQYVGCGEDSPLECDLFDIHFKLNGEPVDVLDEKIIKKLIGNKSFKFEPVLSAPVHAVENNCVPEGDAPDVLLCEKVVKKQRSWSKKNK